MKGPYSYHWQSRPVCGAYHDEPLWIATCWGLCKMTRFVIMGRGDTWVSTGKKDAYGYYRHVLAHGYITHAEATLTRKDPATGITMRGTITFTRGDAP